MKTWKGRTLAALAAMAVLLAFACDSGLLDLIDDSIVAEREYSLVISSDAGCTAEPSGTVTVRHGVDTGVSATLADGYSFGGWEVLSGEGVTIQDPAAPSTLIKLVAGDASVRAKASIKTYTLIIEDDGHCTTVPSGSMTVTHGVPTAVSATPAAEYDFVEWEFLSGTGTIASSGSAATQVTLTVGDATVRALRLGYLFPFRVGYHGRHDQSERHGLRRIRGGA